MTGDFDKAALSERDICTQFIIPALVQRGWDLNIQIREEVTLTAGRVIVKGRLTSRGKQKRADYVLYCKPGIPLAVVEEKDNNHSIGSGMQQAIASAESLLIKALRFEHSKRLRHRSPFNCFVNIVCGLIATATSPRSLLSTQSGLFHSRLDLN